MRPCEIPTTCRECDRPTTYCDSVPDPANSRQGDYPAYKFVPLCFLHAVDRRSEHTSRVEPTILSQGVARLDRGRASGECGGACGV
jgi:hypothetical protein